MINHKQKEPGNPFDDILFWLKLASIDFSFGLGNPNEIENVQDSNKGKGTDYQGEGKWAS
jgi:hypothetical protein